MLQSPASLSLRLQLNATPMLTAGTCSTAVQCVPVRAFLTWTLTVCAQAESATYFLFWDFVALWACMMAFVAMEDGVLTALAVTAVAPLISPGAAFCLYLGRVRERRIASYITEAPGSCYAELSNRKP